MRYWQAMRPGSLVADRFEIEKRASVGGTAAVYRARDRRTGQPVALKVLFGGNEDDAERFAREARMLFDLQHPAIVSYVSHGPNGAEGFYLAMEWLEGETLTQRLTRGRLSVNDSIALVKRVSEALAVAHERGIVHRDIKPSNLFLPGGQIELLKVLDFGIARLWGTGDSVTKTGTLVGTPGYMAPEQARGAKDLDARADVFALGCVLFECLTGKPAFASQDMLAVLAKILLSEAPRVRELRGDVPEALDDLVARMLSKTPEQRPIDGAAVAEELGSLASGDRTERIPIPPPTAITDGEQRFFSVLLARVAQPAMGEKTTPMRPRPEADRASRALEDTAARFGGRLERLADGSMVVTLQGHGAATDQAAQAARCALALRNLVTDMPMALATGRRVMTESWPVGEVIDRAAQLLRGAGPPAKNGAARQRPIYLDEDTAGLLDTRFVVGGESVGLALMAEEALAEESRTLLGRPTPCVGRERELAILDAALGECALEGMARAVLVTAPPGVGKSRLRHEFVRRVRVRTNPVDVWIARGDPLRAGSPFGLLATAIRRAARIVDGEPLAVKQQKLRTRVARGLQGADLLRVAEFLGELIGVPFRDQESVQLRAARKDAGLMGDQLRRAWEDFVAGECALQPVVILLEDLQWGDQPTVSFLDAALGHLHDRPLMILALARPEVHDVFPGLWAGHRVKELRLPDLTPPASAKLVRRVLGPDVSQAVVDRIVARAQGNAFYLEELVRAVAEGKVDMPGTVLAMAQARLEGLDGDARRLLRAGSVFGEVFWGGGAAKLLGEPEPAEEQLAELVRREVLVSRAEERFPGQSEFGFRHTLLREAAYASLTEADRVLGHRLAGEWLEQAGERDAAVLAEHFERGGDPRRALTWYVSAAEQALEANDFEAVLVRAQRAIAAGAQGELAGSVRLFAAEAHRWLGDNAGAMARAREAMELLPRGTSRWYEAAAEVAVASGQLGDHEALEAVLGELRAPRSAPSLEAQLAALVRATLPVLFSGEYDLARALLDAIEDLEDRLQPHTPALAARIQAARAWWALHAGDPAGYLAQMEAAVQSYEQAGDRRNACLMRVNAGYGYLQVGEYALAERVLRETLEAAAQMGLPHVAALAEHNLGFALAHLGVLDEAQVAETHAVDAFDAQDNPRLQAASRVYLARILTLARDLDGAERVARQAVDMTGMLAPVRLGALATLADVLLRMDRVGEALAAATEAMRLLGELGRVEEGEAFVRLVFAETLHAAGDREGARATILEARERLLARAERIPRPAWRKGFLEAVPAHARTVSLAREWDV